MPLSQEQREALEQLWAVTDSSSDAARERDERMLRDNGFDVQRTVEQIFSMDVDGPPPTNPGAGPSRARLEIDESEMDTSPLLRGPGGMRRLSGNIPRRVPSGTAGSGSWLSSTVLLPFRLVFAILQGSWSFILRSFVPLSWLRHLPRWLLPSSPGQSTPRRPQNPTAVSQAFVRDLEQFTGCSTTAGTLPEFWVGPYRDFLMEVRKQCRIALVVLVCAEHEDDEEFKRDVLCDPEFVRMVKEKDIMLWAADITSKEGYQVAQTLHITTYPSLTFLSLLPTPGNTATSAARLQVLTSLSGPPSTTTSTSTILQTMTTAIVPRTSAFLARFRRERLTLEESRHLRAEQDRKFKEAEARDREKTRVKKEQEAAEKLKKEEEEQAEKAKRDLIQNRTLWRRYARKHLLPPSEGSIRVALRVPSSSERNIRNFQVTPSTTQLFIYAETLLLPKSDSPETDPDTPPVGYEPSWDFRIVTNYPRKEIERVETGGEEVWAEVRKAGGALFAEKTEGSTWGDAEMKAAHPDSDDEEEDD